MEKEIELLSRVAANHLFLAQFEPLRAVLLSLHKRRPDLAVAILRTILSNGGRLDGALFSASCPSPAHLAWLSALLLIEIGAPGVDPDLLKLKAEFVLLLQLVISKLASTDRESDEKDGITITILNKVLELGLRRLSSEVADEAMPLNEISLLNDADARVLWRVFIDDGDIFDALCLNIQRQLRWSEPEVSELAISVGDEGAKRPGSAAEESEVLAQMQRSVQLARLDVMRERLKEADLKGAASHLRFLHLDHGVEEVEYKMALQEFTKMVCPQNDDYGETWVAFRNNMMLMYAEALPADCIQLVQMIQVIQDEMLSEEFVRHKLSDTNAIPLPLKKYLNTLASKTSNFGDENAQDMAIKSCLRDLYHFARISGTHILECIMDTSLSLIRMERLQEASDVLSLFPLLQPLAAVLGWDLLSGKTEARRKMMQMLWTSKSQALRLEVFSVYGKHSNEISCVDYLCDLLCYHLDLAYFVACVNTGKPWNSKDSLLFPRNEKVQHDMGAGIVDPFVENFVLERLAVQAPLRVLFDVVPGIKFQDAFELINMHPAASSSSAWKRMQDIELMHMHYALESAVSAIGSMECYLGDENEKQFRVSVWYLKELENQLGAITYAPRKIFMVSIVTSLLYMDEIAVDWTQQIKLSEEHPDFPSPCCEGGNKRVVSFIRLLLNILRHNLPALDPELEHTLKLNNGNTSAILQALEWRISNAKRLIEDWEWRLSILHHLQPISGQPWSWKEALAILRAAPSKLLNLCMQRAKYDIGEEAVHRFSLPPEDKATLEIAEWVAGAFQRASVEAAVSRVAEGTPNAVLEIDLPSFRAQLGSLATILLCIDVAATSAKSVEISKLLLNQARGMLSEIYPGSSPKVGSAYWDQIREVAIISVTRRILQCLHDLSDKEKGPTLQELLSEGTTVSSSSEPTRHGQKQRALVILHQMIDDAHRGKRQFLSGKLHNLARALADEDSESIYYKGEASSSERQFTLSSEKGVVLGLGFKAPKQASSSSTNFLNNTELAAYDTKDSGMRFFGPLTTKPCTYLSSFIIYIATIGDIVDGVDTTHDFNFFSLVYEWPKDLLTRLVFERGSTDAAGKIADIMCVDFVHEVISACVPPVLPPRSGHGWACIPVSPTCSLISSENQPLFSTTLHGPLSVTPGSPLFLLQLDIVKHLAKLSPVRAVLACVFGTGILSSDNEPSSPSYLNNAFVQTPDVERLFYEFALDQSERFPTLNRWIQMQSNLHRVSESVIAAKSSSEVPLTRSDAKLAVKRSREPTSDTESEVDDLIASGHSTSNLSECSTEVHLTSEILQNSPKSEKVEPKTSEISEKAIYLSFDWENEGPYEKAVERLVEEGKLMDALALSDRFLCNGASDQLLQLLIERGEVNSPITGQTHGYGARNFGSNSWQYCLRLKDKQLAARLALKYLHHWDLDAAMDVLTMCGCHLSQSDPIRNEVLQLRQALRKYNHILCADDRYTSWQEVEADCKEDPEGLALRLAGKGAVSAALEVAESASLSIDLRRELQGRQLVKLLTADPLSGGGPAEASRFLSKLRDSDDALPVAIGAMQLLPDLRSKQLLVHFFLKRRVASLSDAEVIRLNSWALGLRVLSCLPLPSQQRCSSLHEHPHLILEVLLMMKQLQSASLILAKFPSLRDDNLILSYAAKAVTVNITSVPREPRISISGPRAKQKARSNLPARSLFTQSISNLQKEARRAFSWNPRELVNRDPPKDVHRKRKSSGFVPSERVSGEAMVGIREERVSVYSADGQERVPFLSIAEEWVLTGDPSKDNEVRSSHRYETSPDITLFKALLSLCTDQSVSAKGAVELCINQMKNVLSSQHLPLHASTETLARAYHATETYVQGLAHAKGLLKKRSGSIDFSSNSERSKVTDDASTETGSSNTGGQFTDELSELLAQADIWLGRAELLQSLLGSGIVASLDDIADKDSSARLRDRLIEDERYSMAVYTCKKCKIDAFPVWNAWGLALIRMEHYIQARVKFKQAFQLHKGDHATVVTEIINTIEGGPPADVLAVRSMYEHLAKSAPTILDDSLSADSYLNVLYMPSTFPRSERSRRSQEAEQSNSATSNSDFGDGPRSNLDNIRYLECIYYLQEYARPQMLVFMFRHGHYADACLLFFPLDTIPSPPQPSSHGSATSLSPQRSDPLATDYGTLDDLCDLCFGYGAIGVLEDVISARNTSSTMHDVAVKQYTAAALARICNYCETHRHFNFLYKFQVLKGDHVAAGLCCIQLFVNSSSQEEAIKHLEHAKVHFEEGLSARHRAVETTRLVSKAARGKSASEKLTEEGLVKFSARVAIQMDVVKAFNVAEGPQWKHSLFGNPNDPETFRRRCEVAETLAEKHFDLAFQVIYEFNLPAVDIYAGVAASLAERKKGSQLTEFFKNIKGTIEEDEWDQVLGAAISVYANKHKERPDRLIDMLTSSHRKVLACVVCGRLKTAFQIASRSGSVADVEYVAHQALHANALPVLDLCKQWLAQYI